MGPATPTQAAAGATGARRPGRSTTFSYPGEYQPKTGKRRMRPVDPIGGAGMSDHIPDVFCQVTLTEMVSVPGPTGGNWVLPKCDEPAVSPYGLCRKHQADRERLMTPSHPTNPGG